MFLLGTSKCDRERISGELAEDTHWRASMSPYIITGNLTVPSGVSLTIEPGTTVLFPPGKGMTVRGRLNARGTKERPVKLASPPGPGRGWHGLRFVDTARDNRLEWVDMEDASGSDQAILLERSRLLIDHVRWPDAGNRILELREPDLIVRNSEFPGSKEDDVVHGERLSQGGRLIFEGNTFGDGAGKDVIEFSGARHPGPVVEVVGNTFLGGEDDAIDLDGADARIEGNTFLHFHAALDNRGTSNAISARNSRALVRQNIFFHNDHAVLVEDGAFVRMTHNTVVGNRLAAVQLMESDGIPGRGALIDGNIFWNNAHTFLHVQADTDLVVHRSIVPAEYLRLGEGNSSGDPRFVDENGDFRLRPGSAALGGGPNGLDMGAHIPAGSE